MKLLTVLALLLSPASGSWVQDAAHKAVLHQISVATDRLIAAPHDKDVLEMTLASIARVVEVNRIHQLSERELDDYAAAFAKLMEAAIPSGTDLTSLLNSDALDV